ncbi:hypothetical protein EVJ58_g7604 [Rhodofomes roseus]|uniref:Uncharacterized protein n=1 Tax=Rhodofomes roseus TaxID=34475 RepID=A0A4Y9Y4I0_9APHY|nr:hypothetical protein EVJ58_g7604 [Rhodofomes roseus]
MVPLKSVGVATPTLRPLAIVLTKPGEYINMFRYTVMTNEPMPKPGFQGQPGPNVTVGGQEQMETGC